LDAEGGGIFNEGTVTMQNSTVSANTASGGGVGLGAGGGINGDTSATTTLISGNNTFGGGGTFGPDCIGAVTSGGYNLIGDTAFCSGLGASDMQNVNPFLGILKDNGGPTQTMGLLPGSPAIDAIPLSLGACVVGQAADQRGVARPQGKK